MLTSFHLLSQLDRTLSDAADGILGEREIRCRSTSRSRSILANVTSAYANLIVLHDGCDDRALMLDGALQSHTADEHVYHEMLTHPALTLYTAMHGRPPTSVFLGGSGEGAGGRELLKWRRSSSDDTAEKLRVQMCELDAAVMQLSRAWLPAMAVGLADPRVDVRVRDAVECLREAPVESFGVIILDFPDFPDDADDDHPIGQLYAPSLYRLAKSRLAPGGVLLTQSGGEAPATSAESGREPIRMTQETVAALQAAGFAHVDTLVYPMPMWYDRNVSDDEEADEHHRRDEQSRGYFWGSVALASSAHPHVAAEHGAAASGTLAALPAETVDRILSKWVARDAGWLRFYSGARHEAAWSSSKPSSSTLTRGARRPRAPPPPAEVNKGVRMRKEL